MKIRVKESLRYLYIIADYYYAKCISVMQCVSPHTYVYIYELNKREIKGEIKNKVCTVFKIRIVNLDTARKVCVTEAILYKFIFSLFLSSPKHKSNKVRSLLFNTSCYIFFHIRSQIVKILTVVMIYDALYSFFRNFYLILSFCKF